MRSCPSGHLVPEGQPFCGACGQAAGAAEESGPSDLHSESPLEGSSPPPRRNRVLLASLVILLLVAGLGIGTRQVMEDRAHEALLATEREEASRRAAEVIRRMDEFEAFTQDHPQWQCVNTVSEWVDYLAATEDQAAVVREFGVQSSTYNMIVTTYRFQYIPRMVAEGHATASQAAYQHILEMCTDEYGDAGLEWNELHGQDYLTGTDLLAPPDDPVDAAGTAVTEEECTVGASACAFDNEIDFAALRSELAGQFIAAGGGSPGSGEPFDVDCDRPNAVPPNSVPVGEALTCHVFADDGRTGVVSVRVESVGEWTWSIVEGWDDQSHASGATASCPGVPGAGSAEQAALCLFEAWSAEDRDLALAYATPVAAGALFAEWPSDHMTFDGCTGGSPTPCSFSGSDGFYVEMDIRMDRAAGHWYVEDVFTTVF